MPEPMLKQCGKYITVPELVRQQGYISLRFCAANQSIQVRDDCGRFLGNLKYDWWEYPDDAARHKMDNREPMIKINGVYITVPELVKKYGVVTLTHCLGNDSIQARDKNGKFIGCLKHDWECN